MIVTEYFNIREDGVKLYRTYSDKNYKILQVKTGIQYDEAIDIENAPYTYEETDVLVELVYEEEQYAEAARILLGESE